mmetsp:Transcript_579/g.1350  ORF Transcript_579/g.1350 Transcript_579/m.1350 type:complete len:152 (+) Transcript_579:26-481(+)
MMKMMHTGGKASREKGGGRMMEWAKKVARAFSGETGTDEECRQSMKDRFELIRSVRFPKLEHVTSQDIAAMDKGDYVIVDVRPQRERDVRSCLLPGHATGLVLNPHVLRFYPTGFLHPWVHSKGRLLPRGPQEQTDHPKLHHRGSVRGLCA